MFFKEHKYYNMSLYKFSRSINSTKVPADLAYEGLITKFAWIREARWTEMLINLCVECSLILMIDYSIHYHDKDTLFRSCWLHQLPFIRWHAYIICFTIDHKCSKCLTEFLSPTLNCPILNNTAYSILSPNIITANISGYCYSYSSYTLCG